MRKMLLFDSDRSLATIGGAEGAEEYLGIPPVRVEGVDDILSLLRRLFKKQIVEIEHPLFPDETTREARFVLNEKGQDIGLDGLVLDSLSRTAQRTKEDVFKERKGEKQGKELKQMDQRAYGMLKDKMIRFITTLTNMDVTVITTTHIRREKDEIGQIMELPKIPGSARESVQEHFDVIAYNRVEGDGDNQNFTWQVRPTERRLAKDRASALEPDENGRIPQNYQYVLNAYRDAGIPNPNILVLGQSGTGKTHAIPTVNDPEYDE